MDLARQRNKAIGAIADSSDRLFKTFLAYDPATEFCNHRITIYINGRKLINC